MTLDEAIEEMRRHEEYQRDAEMYEVELSSITERIREVVTDDQLKSWKMIESLLYGESAKSKRVSEDRIRERLKNPNGGE